MSIMGIDIGSSSCKAVVFNNNGDIIGKSICNYWTRNYGTFSEIDAEVFWRSTIKVIRDASEKAEGNDIEAIALSSHGETLICVDGKGECIYPAIMNNDTRAYNEVNIIENVIDSENIYSITGAPLHSMFPLSKILWLKINNPDIYNRSYIEFGVSYTNMSVSEVYEIWETFDGCTRAKLVEEGELPS